MRPWRLLSPAGRRITARACADQRRRAGFHMPARSWRRELAFRGARTVGAGVAEQLRLHAWAAGRGRADGRGTRTWVVRALLKVYRKWPGQEEIAAGGQQLADVITRRLAGPKVSRQTVQRVLQEMVADGVLWLVRRGCSRLITRTRNHASVYAVIEPDALAPDDQDKVDQLRQRLVGHLPVGDRDTASGSYSGQSLDHKWEEFPRERATPQRIERPELHAPVTARERWAAIDWLITDLGWHHTQYTRVSLMKSCRALFAAGWSAVAVRAAIDRRPDGTPFPGPLPGWRDRDSAIPFGGDRFRIVSWRLKHWRTADGEILPPPVTARRPARGRPRMSETVRHDPSPAAAPVPSALRNAIRASIAGGRAARQAADQAFRDARRLVPRG